MFTLDIQIRRSGSTTYSKFPSSGHLIDVMITRLAITLTRASDISRITIKPPSSRESSSIFILKSFKVICWIYKVLQRYFIQKVERLKGRMIVLPSVALPFVILPFMIIPFVILPFLCTTFSMFYLLYVLPSVCSTSCMFYLLYILPFLILPFLCSTFCMFYLLYVVSKLF